jgi:hypothetical protein
MFCRNMLPLSSGFKSVRRRNLHGHYGRVQWKWVLRSKGDIKTKVRDKLFRNVGTRIQVYRLSEGNLESNISLFYPL